MVSIHTASMLLHTIPGFDVLVLFIDKSKKKIALNDTNNMTKNFFK